MTRAPLVLLLALAGGGCFTTRYVAQAAYGQLELLGYSRPLDEVLADPRTSERTVALLRESRAIVDFAQRHGLDSRRNYRRYVELDRQQVVWFVTASRPLAFEPKVWRFPIAGSFPYLGWFDRASARRFLDELSRDGWDVYMRPVRAYSTGGWFRDPITSTMLLPGDDAIAYLAGVLLHELVHANVLMKDQAVFNESVASFVGDELCADYLAERFGTGSPELAAYLADRDAERAAGRRMARAYAELDALYESDAGDAAKRAGKERVTAELQEELKLSRRPNNASLQGFKTYNSGQDALAALFVTCGRSWPRFLDAIRHTDRAAFTKPHQEELDAVIQGLAPRCGAREVFTPAFAARARAFYGELWRQAPVFGPAEGQDRLHVAAFIPSEIGRSHPAAQTWLALAPALRPWRVWLTWAFADRQDSGMVFDGMVFLGDRFVWFPQPWRLLAPTWRVEAGPCELWAE